jgi:hypothetical protein
MQNFTLLHFGTEPLVYGIVIIAGLILLLIKFYCGLWESFFWDIAIFATVFWMHGGTMKGGMAAAVAALIGGIVVPPLIKVIRIMKRGES